MLVKDTLPKQAAAGCHLRLPERALLQSQAAVQRPLPLPGTLLNYSVQSFFFHLNGLPSNSCQPQLQVQLEGTSPDQGKMGCTLLYTIKKDGPLIDKGYKEMVHYLYGIQLIIYSYLTYEYSIFVLVSFF